MPAAVLVAHLPGKHDQSTHAHGGAGVRSSLAQARTVDEVNAAAGAEAKRITGRTTTFDMAGSDVEVAKEHAEGVLLGMERYPNVRVGQVVTYGPGGARPDVFAQHPKIDSVYAATHIAPTQPGGVIFVETIGFNARYAGDSPRYRAGLDHDVTAGYAVKGGPKSTGAHEYGHLAANQTASTNPAMRVVSDRARTAGVAPSMLIREQVSGYAATSKHELMAEAFADVVLHGPGASDASHAVVAEMDAGYARNFPTTAALVAADPGQPYVSPDDLNSIIPLWQAAVAEHVTPVVAEVFRDTADQLHAQLVNVTDLPQLPSISSLAAETYLAQAANTFEQVGDDLWETARTQLLEGFQKGESIPELAARLRASAGLSAKTAVLVARTQVLDASNAASIATARVSGIPMRKGWLDTPDARTRESHLLAGSTYGTDEQMIDLEAQFIVGGYSCDRPHDPVLPPSEKYNCRCSLAYSVSDDDVAEARDLWTPEPPIPNTTPIPSSQLPGDTPTVAEARNVADLLAEAEELIGNEVDSPILAARLRALAARQNIPAEVSQGLVDAAGDVAGLRKALRKVAKDADIIPIGQAGHIVLFDAAIHRSAETVRAGEAVEIFRPGAWYDGRGGRVLLFKALVETPGRAPRGAFGTHTSGQAGIASTLVAHLPGKHDQSSHGRGGGPELLHDDEATINATYNYTDEKTGLTAEVSRISNTGPHMSTYVSIDIKDRDGNVIGNAERIIRPPDQRTVEHGGMAFEGPFQGQGFASRYNAHVEDAYRENGIEKITLNANFDVGGYAWARAGYDFSGGGGRHSGGRASVAARARKEGRKFNPDVQAEIERVASNPNASPIDFAMIGHQPGVSTWPGKQIMLGSVWEGVKTL